MADDDLQNFPADQGLPSDLDASSPYAGNRPASGARRATPGEVLSQDFQGAQNAGDFLGLDVEFTAGQDPAAAGLDLTQPPMTYDPGQALAPAPLPAGDAAQEFAQAPSAFEFGEDLGSEEGEIALEEPPVQSRRPLLVGVLLVAALGAGGYLYGPGLYSRYFRGGEEVAKVGPEASPSSEAKTPGTNEAPAPGKPAAEDSRPVTAGPVTDTKTPAREPAPSNPVSDAEPSGPEDSAAFDPAGLRGSLTAGEGKTSETPVAATDGEPLAGQLPKAGAQPQGFPDLAGTAYEWATLDELEMIWRGSLVPMEAVHAPVRTLMPRVGRVRVFTTSGDVFDGRLYAVGENRVWIDAAPGRIGLDGDRVERIEVLPPDPAGQLATHDEGPVAGGKRVRVRVPGGMLFGRVLKSEGEDVTLALDDGGRVHVKADSIEELGSGRAIVVRR